MFGADAFWRQQLSTLDRFEVVKSSLFVEGRVRDKRALASFLSQRERRYEA